jgi:hypothetical protein
MNLKTIVNEIEEVHDQCIEIATNYLALCEKHKELDMLYKSQCLASDWTRTKEDEQEQVAVHALLLDEMESMNVVQRQLYALQNKFNLEFGMPAIKRWRKK